ncbi:MAG: hypothetical protein WBL46_07020 [Nitrososphaeraceae archaeon]
MNLLYWNYGPEKFLRIDLHQKEKEESGIFREQFDKSERKLFDEMMSY